ncbi:MAG TPA: hypothetical protein VG755_41000 [Nannocystaceae bacterium]|nr:hypothetical protein [Nannocystaceae bacterium]
MLGWFARRGWYAIVVAGGCSSAADSSLFESGGESGTEITGTASEGDTEGPNATGPADTTGDSAGESGEGDGADDSDSTGGAPADEACEGVECGNGNCASPDGLTPQCMCDPGYAAVGLSCVACEEHAPDATLDIPVMTGAIDFTVGGLVPPKSDYEDATLWLRNRNSGDAVLLGNTHDDGPFPFSVVRGEYDVYYEHESGGTVLPRNRKAVVGHLFPEDSGTIALDVPVVHVQGAITIDGQVPPDSSYDSGRLWLRNLDSGDEVLLGDTHEGTIDVRVMPGEYALHYALQAGGTNVPLNRDAHLYDVKVAAGDPETPMQLDVAIDTVAVNGAITIGGQVPPASAYENGRIRLVGVGGADEIVLGETRDAAFEARVVPGTYEVIYERIAGSTMVPANMRAYLNTIALDSDGEMPIDVPVVSLAGAFTINDAPPPVDPGDDGLVTLRTDAGDAVVLGNTHDGGYARRVVPGYYDVYYGQDQSAGGVPTNTNARVLVALDANLDQDALDIDIGKITVSGSILVDGMTPPTSDYDDGHIYLRDIETGDSALLASTRAGQFTAAVVPGLYDIVYVVETPGPELPINAAAVLDTIDVSQQAEFDVEVDVVALGGAITIDGATPPATSLEAGLLALRDARTGDELLLGSTASGGFAQPVTPGDYLVFYRVQQSSGEVPLNSNANLGCWTLSGK